MLEKVASYIRWNRLFSRGDTLVVAVSGGADSVALLDILSRLEEYRFRLVVAHLNHRLRGAESDGDEEFVRTLANRYRVQLVAEGVDVKAFCRDHGFSLEEGGRVCRYAFFERVAAKYGAAGIVLAHHADDQAETVLMRLIRGSAGSGLCGMVPRSADGRFVRPLLGITRAEIERYLDGRGLSYRTDSSNADTSFLRNRIRHELIPCLREYNPSIATVLSATAEALAADEELLQSFSREIFYRHAVVRDGVVTVSALAVREELRGGRLRLYRDAIREIKGDLRRISHRHLDDIDRLVHDSKPHMALTLPEGVNIARSYDAVRFSTLAGSPAAVEYEMIIDGPGTFLLPGGFTLSVSTEPATFQPGRGQVLIDMAAAPFPWTVRPFRDGDRLHPSGMTGTKKVKELFMENRVPQDERRRIPLLFSGDELIWVCGIRASSVAAVTERTESPIVVAISAAEP